MIQKEKIKDKTYVHNPRSMCDCSSKPKPKPLSICTKFGKKKKERKTCFYVS